MSSKARFPLLKQRREDALTGKLPGQNIGHRKAAPHRILSRTGAGQHHPAHGLHDQIVSRALAVGTGEAEAGDGGVNQTAIVRLQRFVIDAQPLDDSWAKILNDDIGFARQLAEGGEVAGLFQIESDTFFVSIQREKICAFTAFGGLPPMASLIAAIRLFDLDDSRTKIAEQHGAEGSCNGARQIENKKAVEGAGFRSGAFHSRNCMLSRRFA